MRQRLALGMTSVSVLLVLGLAVSARLGSPNARTPAAVRPARATTSSSVAPGGVGARGGTAHATPHASATPAWSAGTAPAGVPSQSWFTVRVAASCVVPGGTQTVIIQSRPGYVVAYNTTYSDGRRGDVHGGQGYSPTNADGSYRSTFTVVVTAPAGTVAVTAGTQRGTAPPITARTSFTVAAHC